MKVELKKEITFTQALATVIGTVIGAGVFFKAATVYAITKDASLGLTAWILGGIISVCAGLTGAELAAAIPHTGGMVVYIEHTYGKLMAFLLGWAQTIVYFPASIAGLAIIFATQCVNLFQLSSVHITWISILAASSITALNFLGAKIAGRFQAVSTICKLIPLALIIIVGLVKTGPVDVSLFPTTTTFQGNGFSTLGKALLATLFAYDGWIWVGNMAGEMKHPKRDLPHSIAFGLIGVTIVYFLINVVFLKTLPLEHIAGNENAASEAAKVIFGELGGKLVTIGILISVYGGINGYTMTGMRVPYVLSRQKLFPFHETFAKLSPKTSIPYTSGLLILAITIIMIFSGSFDLLTDMVTFVIWIFYTLTFCAVFILRKREPDLKRPYRVPLYPIIPLIAITGGIFIVINTLFSQTNLALVGLGLTLIGIPVYFYEQKKIS